ncbi:Putative SET domain superfamily protein [Colletotrichum destructivum]|uniref:SET domain superfamily protein n=1 Tax=Colletotrichum destructivum TaxID=34406 RepID=A0AAX4J4J1_9PEZI|nr:Putative SET domain superfamily protein [Colletotrichum destructivum]
MHLSRVFGVVIYFGEAFSRYPSTLHVTREIAGKLAVIRDDNALCPLSHRQPNFNFPTSQHNTSSDQQSTTCIWTDNNEKQYCVFADSHFNHGKGIAVITTPDRARHIFNSITSLSGHPSIPLEPLFTTRASGSKGRGIFAIKHIPAGSLITQESPIVFLDRNWMEDISSEEARTALQALAVEKLPSTTRQTVHELYAGPYAYEQSLKQRLWTNGYGVSSGPTLSWPGLESESDLGMIAIHANISDWNLLAHRLYAVRDITTDKEITISYINPVQTFQEQQKYARDVLGFKCAYSQCKAPRKFADLSDDRINEILLLESYLESRVAPAEPTAMAELLVSLYKQEGLDSYICKAYAIEAREWNSAGYKYQARL